MRCVIQRVRSAAVDVGDRRVAQIGTGLVLLVAIEQGDATDVVRIAAEKISQLRIFSDAAGKMNCSLHEADGEVLAVSQFTLAASLTRGRRPSFDRAEEPNRARALFDDFVAALRHDGCRVSVGEFGAHMVVTLENDGPATFIYDSASL